jgi:hypothetical protein
MSLRRRVGSGVTSIHGDNRKLPSSKPATGAAQSCGSCGVVANSAGVASAAVLLHPLLAFVLTQNALKDGDTRVSLKRAAAGGQFPDCSHVETVYPAQTRNNNL